MELIGPFSLRARPFLCPLRFCSGILRCSCPTIRPSCLTLRCTFQGDSAYPEPNRRCLSGNLISRLWAPVILPGVTPSGYVALGGVVRGESARAESRGRAPECNEQHYSRPEKHLAGSRPFHDSATFEKAHLKYL